MTKYKEMGYVLQVGDKIEVSVGNCHWRIDTVTRVTKTMAICQDVGTVRYPREYGFSFYALPYRRTNLQYRVMDGEYC